MSDFRSFWLGKGDFKTPQGIVEVVRDSRVYDRAEAGSEEPLLIFQTSKQQTWLIATTKRLYCVLDDIRRGFTRLQWSMTKGELVGHGEILVPISKRDKTDRTGLLDIGKHRGWLFSKKLFTTDPVDFQVRKLIANKMT